MMNYIQTCSNVLRHALVVPNATFFMHLVLGLSMGNHMAYTMYMLGFASVGFSASYDIPLAIAVLTVRVMPVPFCVPFVGILFAIFRVAVPPAPEAPGSSVLPAPAVAGAGDVVLLFRQSSHEPVRCCMPRLRVHPPLRLSARGSLFILSFMRRFLPPSVVPVVVLSVVTPTTNTVALTFSQSLRRGRARARAVLSENLFTFARSQ